MANSMYPMFTNLLLFVQLSLICTKINKRVSCAAQHSATLNSFAIMQPSFPKILIFVLLSAVSQKALAQEIDSAELADIKVTGYINRQAVLHIPGAVNVVDSAQMNALTGNTLLPALNALPGIRMEERSPASYRLSLRGSLMRSPFGVRNVKVYLRHFPLTDAGGNTYLNILSRNAVENIEVLKGPDGSLFGANSGGVVILNPDTDNFPDQVKAEVRTGSFNLFEENILWRKNAGGHTLRVTQSYESADNYRVNSAAKRFFVDVQDRWRYAKNRELELLALYSRLQYQTPGGLTLEQMQQDPRQARPATKTMPGSAEQKTGTVNKYMFGGLSHKTDFSENLSHLVALFAGNADYMNRFITNYETRDEPTFGWRSYFTYSAKTSVSGNFNWKYTLGTEGAHTRVKIANYDNNKGEAGNLQSAADINTLQHFYFNKIDLSLNGRLFVEAAVSLNFYKYFFKDTGITKSFAPQWMPRAAFSYALASNFIWRGSLSKGYSPPTTAEIRPSDNKIYDQLKPEHGWNYESGFRLNLLNGRLFVDASVFHFGLRDAIVRRTNEGGAEYFVNAGSTKQTGMEAWMNYKLITPAQQLFVKKLHVSAAFTRSFFRFAEYVYDDKNYAGNLMTGVPKTMLSNTLAADFSANLSLSVYYNYTSSLPLNDANDAFAKPYHLLQVKAGKTFLLNKSSVTLHVGADNLLNASYSLGNDLNAFGKRYYNPAAPRNYWVGVVWKAGTKK